MAESAAWLSFARPPAAIAEEFPHVAGWLGARRVAALGAASNLVGMVCPGLHSVFGGIAVDLQSAGDSSRPGLGFEVSSVDERFRMVRMRIAGSGIAGSVDSIARQPPAAQESMAALGRVVVPREFLGSTAMIVGGSRGLGELAAKLVAAGGGRAIVTYSVGKADAERVVNEIRAVGGLSECIHYDVRDAAAGQLPEGFAPTHLYYFATPVIFRHQAEAYSRARLAEFMQFYVDGFWDLVRCLHGRRRDISVFYPSSVYVAELPRAMTEYAMAKSAGEILCTKMNQSLAPLRVLVSRLPRVTTDQTASVVPMETSAPLDVLLPLLRQVQGIRDGG
jgi:NAD(P)-dependent dehydrogenase (short-subunit alcohol dehydrogenase family)